MKYALAIVCLIILSGCSTDPAKKQIPDISVTNEELISGFDEDLQQEIVDYAFLPQNDTTLSDTVKNEN